jgi:hypothetical protein
MKNMYPRQGGVRILNGIAQFGCDLVKFRTRLHRGPIPGLIDALELRMKYIAL